MKVSDLLSSQTVGSSRALSVYASIVFIVLWTGTPANKIPPLNILETDLVNLYWLASGLLVFMTIAHAINMWNDVMAARYRDADEACDFMEERRNEKETTHEITQYAEKKFGEMYRESASERDRATLHLHASGRTIVWFSHCVVPGTATLAAAVLLTNEIYICATVGCC